jgi:hypothetical protein
VSKDKIYQYGFWSLLISGLVLVSWFFGVRDNSIDNLKNQYPLIDPTRNFISQEDFIVNLQPLRESLRNLVRWQYPRQVSVYFEFLNTGANIAINQDIKVWPASFPKVPMAMAVLKKVEDGIWSTNQKFELLEQDKDKNYGTLFNSPTGSVFSLEDLLREILVYSDNTAYRIFLRNVNSKELDRVVAELGLNDLFTEEGLVSSKEYSRLFRSLYVSSFLKRESSEKILTLLSHVDFKNFLAHGIPDGVIFSHKFGIDRTKHAYLDSGIVYVPNRPYLITVAIQGNGSPEEEEEVGKFMKEIAEQTYKYVVDR